MSNYKIKKVVDVWPIISKVVFVPHTEQEYDQLVALLDKLIDEVGENETHPLASLMDLLGTLIEKYETEHIPEFNGNQSEKPILV
ncbi:MAG: hypothetical protein V1872_02800 [bacterium]